MGIICRMYMHMVIIEMDNQILEPFTICMEKGSNDEMSQICIGIIHMKEKKGKEEIRKMQKEAATMAENFGFELSWALQYREAFITEEDLSENVVFDLTRRGVAETVLCPDWCRYNGHENDETLLERLRNIADVFENVLRTADYIDWYIGESGGEEEEYNLYNVKMADLVELVMERYKELGDAPDAHFRIMG